MDKQLGHGGAKPERTMKIHQLIAGSRTGRKHYLDLNSELFDASRSAEAVRQMLDEAEEALRAQGSPLLFVGSSQNVLFPCAYCWSQLRSGYPLRRCSRNAAAIWRFRDAPRHPPRDRTDLYCPREGPHSGLISHARNLSPSCRRAGSR